MEQPVVPNFVLCRFYLTYPSIHFSLFLAETVPAFFLVFLSITIFCCKFPYLISPTSVILPFPYIHHHPRTSSLPSICSHIIPVLSLYHPTPSHLHLQALVKLYEFLFFSWYNCRRSYRFSTSRMHKILLHHPSQSEKSMSTSREWCSIFYKFCKIHVCMLSSASRFTLNFRKFHSLSCQKMSLNRYLSTFCSQPKAYLEGMSSAAALGYRVQRAAKCIL
jgi:hypothetical protein